MIAPQPVSCTSFRAAATETTSPLPTCATGHGRPTSTESEREPISTLGKCCKIVCALMLSAIGLFQCSNTPKVSVPAVMYAGTATHSAQSNNSPRECAAAAAPGLSGPSRPVRRTCNTQRYAKVLFMPRAYSQEVPGQLGMAARHRTPAADIMHLCTNLHSSLHSQSCGVSG